MRSLGLMLVIMGFSLGWALSSKLQGQPASPTRVLDLDGKGGYVELPPNIFNDLDEATVEGWVKWRRFGSWLRFFDSGSARHNFAVTQAEANPDLQFEIWSGESQQRF